MCDTFVALPPATAGGTVIFGKNSDREPNEAQLLEYHPPQQYAPDSRLRCTYLEIPQVREINAVLLSRPFWMWGAEIGANQHGVVIGNEAVWSKMPIERSGRLTGMDLLRLALERATTAATALETITELLAEYGQGGDCGYQTGGTYYHNSYIIADPSEAWVLETAGSLWAAKKINSFYAISNRLTIGKDFQLAHPDLIVTARKKGWLKRGAEFDFAECYLAWFYSTFSGSRTRRQCSTDFFDRRSVGLTFEAALSLLRSHAHSDYNPDRHFLMNSVCSHSGNKIARHAAQSTASMVVELGKNQHTIWATGTSAPCTGIFKPLRFGNTNWPIDGHGGQPGFAPGSRWWRHELLHRTLLKDFRRRLHSITSEQHTLEQSFIDRVAATPASDITALSTDAFVTADHQEGEWLERIKNMPVSRNNSIYYRRYWAHQNSAAGLPLP